MLGQMFAMVNFFLDEFDLAEKWINFTRPFLQAQMGCLPNPDHVMFDSLLIIHKLVNNTYSKKEEDELLNALMSNKERLKIWSDNCPSNYSHKY